MWIPDWALIDFLNPGPRTLLDLGNEGVLDDHGMSPIETH